MRLCTQRLRPITRATRSNWRKRSSRTMARCASLSAIGATMSLFTPRMTARPFGRATTMTTLDKGKSFFTVCRDGKGELCDKPAVCRLRAPDGQLVPGSFHCIEHAAEIVHEYAAKLGE